MEGRSGVQGMGRGRGGEHTPAAVVIWIEPRGGGRERWEGAGLVKKYRGTG